MYWRERLAFLARDLFDLAVAHRAAAEPRDVRQQILDRDLALRRHGVELRRRRRTARAGAASAGGRLPDRHLHAAELGDVARDRIVQPQLSFLDHHHDADADDRLGHRRDAEHRRRRHRLLRLEIHDALRVDVGEATLARHRDHGAGQIAGGDPPLDHLGRRAEAARTRGRRPPASRPRMPCRPVARERSAGQVTGHTVFMLASGVMTEASRKAAPQGL